MTASALATRSSVAGSRSTRTLGSRAMRASSSMERESPSRRIVIRQKAEGRRQKSWRSWRDRADAARTSAFCLLPSAFSFDFHKERANPGYEVIARHRRLPRLRRQPLVACAERRGLRAAGGHVLDRDDALFFLLRSDEDRQRDV